VPLGFETHAKFSNSPPVERAVPFLASHALDFAITYLSAYSPELIPE
jgi:hypothetical protein